MSTIALSEISNKSLNLLQTYKVITVISYNNNQEFCKNSIVK